MHPPLVVRHVKRQRRDKQCSIIFDRFRSPFEQFERFPPSGGTYLNVAVRDRVDVDILFSKLSDERSEVHNVRNCSTVEHDISPLLK